VWAAVLNTRNKEALLATVEFSSNVSQQELHYVMYLSCPADNWKAISNMWRRPHKE
jgi:hypothetical protein